MSLLILRDCPKAVDAFRRRAELVARPARSTALVSLARAYERCEMPSEARKTLERAASEDPRNAAVRVRGAYLASRGGDQEAAARLLAEAEALYRARANFEGVAEVLTTRGTLAAERDQLNEASAALQEALTLARTTKSAHQEVRVLLQQAIVARKGGDLAEGDRLTAQAVELARRNDMETLAMQGLFTAANMDFIKGKLPPARAGYEQALEIATRYRDEGNQARAWLSLASLQQRSGQTGRAAEFLAKAKPYYVKTGNLRVQSQIESLEASVGIARAMFGDVLTMQQRRLERARAKQDTVAVNEALRSLRLIHYEMGRWREAGEMSRQIDAAAPTGPAAEGSPPPNNWRMLSALPGGGRASVDAPSSY